MCARARGRGWRRLEGQDAGSEKHQLTFEYTLQSSGKLSCVLAIPTFVGEAWPSSFASGAGPHSPAHAQVCLCARP